MLPKQYADLANINPPAMVVQLLGIMGTLEGPGSKDNPTIIGWARECGINGYVHDAVPWCGLTMAVCARRAGWDSNPGGNPLWAQNWLQWERPSKTPMLGDVLVFGRNGGGHVGLYLGEDATHFHVGGGNQGNAVSIKRIAKSRLLGARRPNWRIRQPDSVKRIFRSPVGTPSSNEA